MPFGPNRWGVHPRSRTIQAGGIQMYYRNPQLAGHVSSGSGAIDEIDVSKACRLNDTFFDAQPAMDSAFQEVLVDGSVVTITNHLLAGIMTLQVLEQGGFVGRGDFITALQLVQSSKDLVGGTFTVIRNFDGITRIRVYYGVFVKHVPHERVAGNAIVPYPVQLAYAGWYDGIGDSEATKKYIWAVGNGDGTIASRYNPYGENQADSTSPTGSVEVNDIHTGIASPNDNLNDFDNIPEGLQALRDASGEGAVLPGIVGGSTAYPYGDISYVKPPASMTDPESYGE